MITILKQSLLMTACLALLLCGAYPIVVTLVGKLLFHEKISGGFIQLKNGQIVGSKLIGQTFTKPEYFHGRPSAAAYDAANSSGSNFGPTSKKLSASIKENIAKVLKENKSLKSGELPVDAVTSSASGLDPHISPETAYVQASRVAEARNVTVEQITSLIKEHIEGPQLGILGEPIVNVLILNLDLDRLTVKK